MAKKILIVDDSALVRKQLTDVLGGEFTLDFAKNGQEAVDKVLSGDFDGITMDINMPVMDGLTAVGLIMKSKPTPILMVSSLTTEEAPTTLDALELGAVDFIAKPGTFTINPAETADEILSKVRELSRIPMSRLRIRSMNKKRELAASKSKPAIHGTKHDGKILLIGASTGGPGLIEDICEGFPPDFGMPVCIVQHMPEKFTPAFANRLNNNSALTVKESEHNEELNSGVVYLAKGGQHLQFAKKVTGKVVLRHGAATVKRFFTPSVDEMFISALDVFEAQKITAVLLTGIGDDGADGMVKIKKSGGHTIAESEATAVVYGMPKEAVNRGGASEVLPFPSILQNIIKMR